MDEEGLKYCKFEYEVLENDGKVFWVGLDEREAADEGAILMYLQGKYGSSVRLKEMKEIKTLSVK